MVSCLHLGLLCVLGLQGVCTYAADADVHGDVKPLVRHAVLDEDVDEDQVELENGPHMNERVLVDEHGDIKPLVRHGLLDKDVDEEEHELDLVSGPGKPRERLEKFLQIALQAAIAANSSYYAIFGTALGVYREQGPHEDDDDIDLAVPAEQLEDVKKGFLAVNASLTFLNWKGGAVGFRVRETSTDVWGFTPSKPGDYMCIYCQKPADRQTCLFRDAYPTKMLLPTRSFPTRVTDRLTYSEIPMPSDPEAFLELEYGKDFRTPKAHGSRGSKNSFGAKHRRFDMHCLGENSSLVA